MTVGVGAVMEAAGARHRTIDDGRVRVDRMPVIAVVSGGVDRHHGIDCQPAAAGESKKSKDHDEPHGRSHGNLLMG